MIDTCRCTETSADAITIREKGYEFKKVCGGGGKGRERCCNYIIIPKVKFKNYLKFMSFLSEK